MSLIVVGVSYRTANLETLERVVLSAAAQEHIAASLAGNEHVSELMVLSTCNRTELYAEVGTFHGAVTSISEALAAATGMPMPQLRDHLYVHFEDRAVAHLFSVAAGLDSMAIGESQVIGQLRTAMRAGQAAGRLGTALTELVQHALRVGKRVHTETALDLVSRSLVEHALDIAADRLGELGQATAVVIGAGSMSGLAAHTLMRADIGTLHIVNRTPERAARLAQATGGIPATWEQLPSLVAQADIVISCTGAAGHIVVPQFLAEREAASPVVLIDLALPRDVDPSCAQLDAVTVLTLDELGARTALNGPARDSMRVVQDMVTAEVAEFLVHRRAAAVGPTVAALRARAAGVVEREMDRLSGKVELDLTQAAQVRQALHRVAEKILHTPTVRIKQLVGEEQVPGQGQQDYTALMRTLFDLDPHEHRVSALPDGETE
ncbi:MAG: glutamyl-tRNA reductase [Allobranchiibius sp.]